MLVSFKEDFEEQAAEDDEDFYFIQEVIEGY